MTANGFWGLLIEPKKRYSQKVPASFKVTMASLGPEVDDAESASSADGNKLSCTGRTTVMLRIEEQDDYAICSLTPGKLEQQPLELVLRTGESISFWVSGLYPIHLTGYYIQDEEEVEDVDMSEAEEVEGEYDSEDEEDYDSEEAQDTIKKIMKAKRSRQVAETESGSDECEVDSDEEEVEDESAGSHSSDIDDDDDDEGYDSDFVDDASSSEGSEELGSDDMSEDVEESEEEEIVPPGKRSNASNTSMKHSQQPEPKKQKTDHKPSENKPYEQPKNNKQPIKVETKEPKEVTLQNKDQKQKEPNKEQKQFKEQIKKEQPISVKEHKQSPPKTEQKQVETPAKPTTVSTPNANQDSAKKPVTKTLPSGLVIEDITVGNGTKVVKDRRVGISYVGKLQSGKVFDKTQGRDLFYFNVGRGEVTKGMDIGVQGMCLGGKRRLTIPAALAFGGQATPTVPANSTLTFEISVEKVSPAPKV